MRIDFNLAEDEMQRFIWKSVPALLGVMSSLSVVQAQTASPYCNNMLIKGDYGFSIEGTKLAGPPMTPTGPQVGVAMTHFNGDDLNGVGTLTQIDAVTIGGQQVSDFSHKPASGTYTVNPDCTGSFTLTFYDNRPTVTTYFVVVDNGSEIDTVVMGTPVGTPGVIATASVGKRRFSFPLAFPRIVQPLRR
jgi:hypothetical protein